MDANRIDVTFDGTKHTKTSYEGKMSTGGLIQSNLSESKRGKVMYFL